MRAVVYVQCKAFFGSGSLFPGCHEGDVDPCEVVKISTQFFCPSDFGLARYVASFNHRCSMGS